MAAYFSAATLLFSFMVGVSSPPFSVKSTDSSLHFCTICALEVVFLLAAFMPSSKYFVQRGSLLASERVVAVDPIYERVKGRRLSE